jgi:SAM-dependent methyltransferase
MDTVRRLTQCRICESHNVEPFVEVPSLAHTHLTCCFSVCNDCGTVLDDGSPLVTYKESPAMDQSYSDETVLRYYVEVGAGIEFMARVMMGLSESHRPQGEGRPRFLDIGAGFGFACSMAQFQGWEVTGVEPSMMGAFGAQLLGMPILRDYVEQTDLPREHFDFVYSSEVIEHVQDVDKFVATAVSYLKPDGVLLLTTPNGQAVRGRDAFEGEWMEALSAGYHIHLLSPKSMEMVLRRHGMATVHIVLAEGTSGQKRLIALASRTPGHPARPDVHWPRLDSKPFLQSYLRDLAVRREQAGKTDTVYQGALFRLIESLLNAGAHAEAEAAMIKLDAALEKAGKPPAGYHHIRADNLLQYLSQAPAFAGVYVFYKGMLYLNHKADYGRALEWFRLAQRLCTLEKSIPYFTRLYWPVQCQFHVGLALLYDGRKREALHEFDALLAEPAKLPEGMLGRLLWNKAIAHLQLGENMQAFRYFADTWLHGQFANSPDQYLPLTHMTIALTQAANTSESQLRSIENRLNGLMITQFGKLKQQVCSLSQNVEEDRQRLEGVSAKILVDCEQVCRRAEALVTRIDRIAARLRPFYRAARAGYRLLRRSAGVTRRLARRLLGRPSALPAPCGETLLGELLAGQTIEQPFVSSADELAGVGLKISTYMRQLSSTLDLTLCDADGQQLHHLHLSAQNIHDNALHYLTFPPLIRSRGRKFTLRVTTPDAAPGNGVTLWARPGPHNGLRIDRTVRGDELVFEPVYAATGLTAPGELRDLLLLCPDRLGRLRIGIGMRHWEMARALTARGLTVTLATPNAFDADLRGDGFPLVHAPTEQKVMALAARHRCVLVQGVILDQFPCLRASNLPIVVDMITPMHIENLERTEEDYDNAHRALSSALRRGNFFVCGNERQRLHWLGMLAGLGRLPFAARAENPALRRLIDLVPFGIPDQPPVKSRPVLKGVRAGIGREDFVLTWFGGIWDWLDPQPIVRAVAAAWKQEPRVKLFFSAYRRPDGIIPDMARRVRDLAAELGLLDRCVFFNDYPVPFDERGDYLLETDAGILCQANNLETQMSARTRVLDYLWANCPLLINDGDEWAQTIRQHGLGLVLDDNCVELWTEAILRLCRDSEGKVRMQDNIARLKVQLRWTSCVEPLVQFVARQGTANRSYKTAA